MIKISNKIKKEILKFALQDMDSAFYEDKWYNYIDGEYIYNKLSKIIKKAQIDIFLHDYHETQVNIADDVKYIEFGWAGTHIHKGYVDVVIVARMNSKKGENYNNFTELYYRSHRGEEINIAF